MKLLNFKDFKGLINYSRYLVPFLKEAVKLLERTLPESIRIAIEFGRGDLVVETNPTQLQQVITNLAINARDAMPDGGELRVQLSALRVEPGQPPFEGADLEALPETAHEAWVVLTVTDTGTGMRPEVVSHIFEPFFTTRRRAERGPEKP